MQSVNDILAKSVNYGNLSLLDHTGQVKDAIECFACNFDFEFNLNLAQKGAILHDLGKAHPHFQRRMQNINATSLDEERESNFIHRHELSSLAFLPAFPKNEWDSLIDMVVAHHKPIVTPNDSNGRGILDLDNRFRNWIDNHLIDWEAWSHYGFQILKQHGIDAEFLKDEAKKALEYAVDYCETKPLGWSPWRGLLMSADHFASAFMFETKIHLQHLFETPNLNYYFDSSRQSSIYPLSQISVTDQRPHTLLVAPTGAGKTDFLLKRCKGRIFYTLPFQASINAMWERMKKTIPNKDIRLQHATSKIIVGDNLEEKLLQPLVGSSVKVLTPHQMAAIIFGTPGFESVMLDLKGCDIILDEIHTYSDFSQSMVLEIVKMLLLQDCRIHIGTATMPSVLYHELLRILGGEEKVYQVKLADEILDSFNRHKIFKLKDESEVNKILLDSFANNEKVLVIYNTINKAQKVFEKLREAFPEIPMLLIHSRYKRADRVELETRLKTEFNGDGSKEFHEGLKPCLVVSTQVVEVSLDISFDRMITQCAPLDGLIQRFGRVNRKRSPETISKYKPIHVIAPSGNVLPYKMDVLKASFEQLPDHGGVLEERSLQSKIDKVYPDLNKKEIDIHLIFKDNRFKLTELTNRKSAVLVDALEIESASCILSEDRDKYLLANWKDRIQMEIPINWKTISRYRTQFEQLSIGSNPFVVPQNPEEYKIYGLQLVEHDKFL
ncbi:MAG: CRISPR-associated helicase Cas3' [Bacteroidales bacterium]|nr:CRISPR-associated helicase Cas3' [Bacteroidales bacterium]